MQINDRGVHSATRSFEASVNKNAAVHKTTGLTLTVAFYPGSFDPITNGHMDVLLRSLELADQVIVGIGVHPGKNPLFDTATREAMIHEAFAASRPDAAGRLAVVRFGNLVVDAAVQHGATLLIRGLRDATDFAYEMQLAGMNRAMRPELATVFLPASPDVRHISATLVRQVAKMGGDVAPFVPPQVVGRLRDAFAPSAQSALALD